MTTKIIDISTSTFAKRPSSSTDDQASSAPPAHHTSRFKLLLVWAFILLPLAWGIYEAARIAASLIIATSAKS